jgi:hypothetical protein
MEEGKDNEAKNSEPLDNVLAQTPHDVVFREAAHHTGGAATSERTGPKQDVQDRDCKRGKPQNIEKTTHENPQDTEKETHENPQDAEKAQEFFTRLL